MTLRERAITALSRKIPDCVPKDLKVTPYLAKLFKEKTGASSFIDYFKLETDRVEINDTKLKTDFSRFMPKDVPKEKYYIDEFGIGFVPGGVSHFEDMLHPMINFTELKEFQEYPYPDMTADYRKEGVLERVKALQNKGLAVRGVPIGSGTTLDTAWRMRGLENMLCDMMANEELATYHLDKITEISVNLAKFFAECGADVLQTSDNVGTQKAMMISPELFRKWIKPRLKRIIDAAKRVKPDILIFFHSDGNIFDIIEDLIEIRVDILNPLQPECMDPRLIKKKFGDKLSFWGAIGIQRTMPFGTPDEVRAEVKEMIETVGKDGGFLIAPAHTLPDETPWENILAFIEAVEKYGKYRR